MPIKTDSNSTQPTADRTWGRLENKDVVFKEKEKESMLGRLNGQKLAASLIQKSFLMLKSVQNIAFYARWPRIQCKIFVIRFLEISDISQGK